MSERLRQRQFVLLPIDGEAAPVTGSQGRDPGDSTTPADLVELISSIATIGLLQPLLVEAVEGRHNVVAGERRLRALRWGRAHLPDNPNFATAPAVVCPGPLTEEERRVWQLVENLAREDLQPGELAAALLYERSAVLASRLQAAGFDPAAEDVWTIEDSARRWHALERHRRDVGAHQIGAPWNEVLRRIGVQLSSDKAQQMVRAFTTLPRELAWEMDADGVALASRLEFLRLDRGRRDAASAIWSAVRQRGKPRLLTGAVRVAIADPTLTAAEAVDVAEQHQADGNAARAATVLAHRQRQHAPTASTRSSSGHDDETPDSALVDGELVERCVELLGQINAQLRAGRIVAGFAAGTLALHARDLARLIKPGGERAA